MHPNPIRSAALAAILALTAATASAGVCDYKPSRLLETMTSPTARANAGAAASTVGHYTLVNAKTGLTLLGTSGVGASATGLVSGAPGFLASAIAVVTAPATIIAGSVTAVALGGYEGACYFAVERVTDPDLVLAILRDMADRADPDRFALEPSGTSDGETLVLGDPDAPDETQRYEVKDLYIADGMLLHRDRFLNTRIGKVIFVDEP